MGSNPILELLPGGRLTDRDLKSRDFSVVRFYSALDTRNSAIGYCLNMDDCGDPRVSDYTSKWKSGLDVLASFLADILEGRGDPFGHYLHVRLYENLPVITGDVADLELSDA